VQPRRGRGCLAVTIAVAILGAAVGLVVVKGQSFLSNAFTVADYSGPGQGEVVVQVTNGDTSRDIAATLEEHGVVKSAEAFTRAARQDSRALGIQPGYYRLRREMEAQLALDLMLDPSSRILDRVTVPEGRRLSEIIDILAKETGIPKEDFTKALQDPANLGLPDYVQDNVEGVLFPATYDVDPGTTAVSLLQDMAAKYVEVSESLGLVAGAKELGLTPMQVVTVASLVEAEARRPEDFGKVARVIYNRLDSDLPYERRLQLDSTVHYALNKRGNVFTTEKDREVASPYNTYRHPGLPPGPINAPGARALRAALHPAGGDWHYFVTVNLNSGETKFAQTLEQHNAYVRELNAWCRDHRDVC
jgi:UPF0755 protein